MDSRVLLEFAYNWPRMRPFAESAVHRRLVRLTSLIVVLLLALLLWTAAIRAAVAIFALAS
jgi:hypothetical protein